MLERAIACDLPGLRPQDRFDKELHMSDRGRDATLAFIDLLEEKYDVDLPASTVCSRMSVGHLMRLLAEKVGDRETP